MFTSNNKKRGKSLNIIEKGTNNKDSNGICNIPKTEHKQSFMGYESPQNIFRQRKKTKKFESIKYEKELFKAHKNFRKGNNEVKVSLKSNISRDDFDKKEKEQIYENNINKSDKMNYSQRNFYNSKEISKNSSSEGAFMEVDSQDSIKMGNALNEKNKLNMKYNSSNNNNNPSNADFEEIKNYFPYNSNNNQESKLNEKGEIKNSSILTINELNNYSIIKSKESNYSSFFSKDELNEFSSNIKDK